MRLFCLFCHSLLVVVVKVDVLPFGSSSLTAVGVAAAVELVGDGGSGSGLGKQEGRGDGQKGTSSSGRQQQEEQRRRRRTAVAVAEEQEQQQQGNQTTTTTTTTTTVVNFVFTRTTLLSGRSLSSCQNVTDPTCTQGVAAVDAYNRHLLLTTDGAGGEQPHKNLLVLPTFDKSSQFVGVHPLGWNVNRLVLQGIMKWNIYTSSPTLLTSDKRDGGKEDLSLLQRDDFSFLLSNAFIPPNNSWNYGTNFHQSIHYDSDTNIALIVIGNNPTSHEESDHLYFCHNYYDSQVESAMGMLEIIKRKNQKEVGNHCLSSSILQDKEEEDEEALQELYALFEKDTYANHGTTTTTTTTINNNATTTATSSSSDNNTRRKQQNCWIPVILYTHDSKGAFEWFLLQMKTATYPPAVILDTRGNHKEIYGEPTPILASPNNNNNNNDTTITSTSTEEEDDDDNDQKYIWVHSYNQNKTVYMQHQITLNYNNNKDNDDDDDDDDDNDEVNDSSPQQYQTIESVTYVERSLKELPEEFKDDTYAQQIEWLRKLADQAQKNDFVIGNSHRVPPQMRRCNGSQCDIGSLFTDAMKWQARADIAFITSGGLGGPGWDEGPIRVSDIWSGLPFPDAICTGVISGMSLLPLFDYSIRTANLSDNNNSDSDDTDTDTNTNNILFDTTGEEEKEEEGNLLQVSGIRVTYNSKIPRGQSRLVNLEVYNKETGDWEDVEYFKLYKFATTDYVCTERSPFPSLLGYYALGVEGVDGEIGGVPGELLVHDAVADFFEQLPGQYYELDRESRLVDDTEATNFLLVDELQGDCQEDQFLFEGLQICAPCPDYSEVSFSAEHVDFTYQLGGDTKAESRVSNKTTSGSDGTDPLHHLTGIIVLTNYADNDFEVTPANMPSWLEVRHAGNLSAIITEGSTYQLRAQSSQALHLRALVSDSMQVGVNSATVSWSIAPTGYDLSGAAQCKAFNRDSTFNVSLKVVPKPNEHHLGMMRGVGLTLMAVVWFSAVYFGAFVFKYRNTHIVNVMQPLFLSTLCLGIFIMASSIFPLSFDDGVMPENSCHAMCILFPWLLSTGFVLVFSALFSKLWRINQLFHAQRFQRVKVTEKDVMWPFAILFSLNLACLLAWTAVDPLLWSRERVKGQPWESYGTCESDGVGYVFMWLIVVINFVALLLACYQAWKARDISDEFSESKYLGLAIFTWLQVSMVGLPSIFLVEGQNYTARYFLKVGLIFVMSETMLLVIFIPLLLSIREYNRTGDGHAGSLEINGQGTTRVSGLPAKKSPNQPASQRSWQTPQATTEEDHPS